MISLDKAIQRAFDSANLEGDSNMKYKLYASVVPNGRPYKTSKMEYHIILWIDDMYLVDYVRHGKKAAYALKHAFEATGIAPAE